MNLENNCDIASRQWVETQDSGYLRAYEHYKNEMIRIKEIIIESERQGELDVWLAKTNNPDAR